MAENLIARRALTSWTKPAICSTSYQCTHCPSPGHSQLRDQTHHLPLSVNSTWITVAHCDTCEPGLISDCSSQAQRIHSSPSPFHLSHPFLPSLASLLHHSIIKHFIASNGRHCQWTSIEWSNMMSWHPHFLTDTYQVQMRHMLKCSGSDTYAPTFVSLS